MSTHMRERRGVQASWSRADGHRAVRFDWSERLRTCALAPSPLSCCSFSCPPRGGSGGVAHTTAPQTITREHTARLIGRRKHGSSGPHALPCSASTSRTARSRMPRRHRSVRALCRHRSMAPCARCRMCLDRWRRGSSSLHRTPSSSSRAHLRRAPQRRSTCG